MYTRAFKEMRILCLGWVTLCFDRRKYNSPQILNFHYRENLPGVAGGLKTDQSFALSDDRQQPVETQG